METLEGRRGSLDAELALQLSSMQQQLADAQLAAAAQAAPLKEQVG